MEPIHDVKVYLKSGAVVEFVTRSLEAENNSTGGLTSLSWENVDGETTLFKITLDQIAAITYKQRAE